MLGCCQQGLRRVLNESAVIGTFLLNRDDGHNFGTTKGAPERRWPMLSKNDSVSWRGHGVIQFAEREDLLPAPAGETRRHSSLATKMPR
jgi:hypothetical protein